MSKSLVSIVTPCYNGEKYIGRFFESILNQTYSDIELIFVNDGSIDRTESIVKKYKEIFARKNIKFVYQYQKNAGQAAALNRGLKLFSGKYLTWLDSDDEIMPECIEEKVQFLENNPEYVYCYGKAIEVNESVPEQIVRFYGNRKKTGRYDFFEDVIFCKNIFFSGYMVKTDAFDRVIKNREIYSGAGGQNAQLLLPFAWYYGEPGYVEEAVYKYYVHLESHSHSQDTSEKIINQLYNYEKILLSTIERIEDDTVLKYIKIVKVHYAKLRFGNSIDTKNTQLIKIMYKELKQLKAGSFKDFLLYFKYTNRMIRKYFRIEG